MEGLALREPNVLIKLFLKFQIQAQTTTPSWQRKLEITSKLTSALRMGQLLGSGQRFKAHQILLMRTVHNNLTK